MGTFNEESRHRRAKPGQGRAEERLRTLVAGLDRLGWPQPSVDALLSSAHPTVFSPGETVYREGSAATRLYWMLAGVVKLFVPGAQGRRVLVGLAKPGTLLGSYMVLGERRLDRAVALTEVHAAELDRERFRRVTSGLPAEVIQRMTGRTLEVYSCTFRRTVRLLTLDLRGKLALGLLDVADGYGVRDADGVLLKVRLTHGDLAELAGVSRARVTKVLSEFARAGAIVRRGRDLVVRRELLQAVAENG